MKIMWKALAMSFLAVALAAAIGSLATGNAPQSQWYLENKPSFTPPNYIFGPTWTVLYILVAISLYLAWTNAGKEKRKVAIVFGSNLFLNTLWSVLFFGLKSPLLAFVDIILLWTTIILMMKVSYKLDRRVALLLAPYLIWVTFAAVLNLEFLF